MENRTNAHKKEKILVTYDVVRTCGHTHANYKSIYSSMKAGNKVFMTREVTETASETNSFSFSSFFS